MSQPGEDAAALRRALMAKVQKLVPVGMAIPAVGTVARGAMAAGAIGTAVRAAAVATVVAAPFVVHAVIELAARVQAGHGNRQQDEKRPFHDGFQAW
jgi:hypothetical protein